MNELICPLCGGNDLVKDKQIRSVLEPFGGKKEIETVNYICNTCGFNGDFLKENEKALQSCIDELKIQAVKNILQDFLSNNYSFSAIERALEIPQRTLSKWKNSSKKPSAAVLSLLKYLHLFPWLIEVAEQKYDYSSAQRIHIKDAFNTIVGQMAFSKGDSKGLESTATFDYLRVQIKSTSSIEQTDDNYKDYGFSLIEPETVFSE